MPTQILTDTRLRTLKAKEKPYKVSDGTVGGLHVVVSKVGGKLFRLAYKFDNKHQLLTLGTYPTTTLAEAREKAQAAKKQLAQGVNPASTKRAEKTQIRAASVTFRSVAREWLAFRQPELSQAHWNDTKEKLELHVYPRFGDKAIAEVGKADIKTVLDTLQAQRKFATLKKIRTIVSQILRFAIDREHPGVVDWAAQLQGQYPNPVSLQKHRAAITDPRQVKDLMLAIEGYAEISLLTCLALKFSALTFCRPGEVRHAEWTEFDFDNTLWRIPAEKMKAKQPHLVPLARQTLAVLEQLKSLSGHTRYLFPSVRTIERPMSEATITGALRRMGFTTEQMCAHGFRGMASSILNEQGVNRDWIERQLAHGPQDKVRAAYNHSEFLDGRRGMMQDWADFLSGK